MIVCSVVLCVCCQSVLLVVLVGGLSLVHELSSRSSCCIIRHDYRLQQNRWTFTNYMKADWTQFTEDTESAFSQTTIPTNIHTANIICTNIILMADKNSIPNGKMQVESSGIKHKYIVDNPGVFEHPAILLVGIILLRSQVTH